MASFLGTSHRGKIICHKFYFTLKCLFLFTYMQGFFHISFVNFKDICLSGWSKEDVQGWLGAHYPTEFGSKDLSKLSVFSKREEVWRPFNWRVRPNQPPTPSLCMRPVKRHNGMNNCCCSKQILIDADPGMPYSPLAQVKLMGMLAWVSPTHIRKGLWEDQAPGLRDDWG